MMYSETPVRDKWADDHTKYGYHMAFFVVPVCRTTTRLASIYRARYGHNPHDGLLAHYWYRVLYGWQGKANPELVDVVDFPPEPTPEPPTVLPPGAAGRRMEGQLGIAPGGRTFVDDNGAVLPVLCHAGDLLSAYKRDPGKARAAVEIIADAGYMGVRTWTILGGDFWRGREIAPDDWFGTVIPFVELLQDHDLKWLVSQGDIARILGLDQVEAMRRLGQMLAPVKDVVCGVDAGNENWNRAPYFDMETSRRALQAFLDNCDVPIRSITDSPEDDLSRHHTSIATVGDVHGYRGGHWWDKIRHVFSLQWEGHPPRHLMMQSEPPGEGASVTNHPEELDAEFTGLLTAQHLMCRQLSVFMSGPGVMLEDPEDFTRLRGFYVPPKIARILPQGVMWWGGLTHGGDSQRGVRLLSTSHDLELRADQAYQTNFDGVVAVCYGPNQSNVRVERPVSGRVYRPSDGAVLHDTAEYGAGSTISWHGKGCIFVGARDD